MGLVLTYDCAFNVATCDIHLTGSWLMSARTFQESLSLPPYHHSAQ